MRLFLLPLTRSRSLLLSDRAAPSSLSHIQKLQQPSAGIINKVINRASNVWSSWQRADRGWKKSAAKYGDILLSRIPVEESGLRGVLGAGAGKLRLDPADSNQIRDLVRDRKQAGQLEESAGRGELIQLTIPRGYARLVGADREDVEAQSGPGADAEAAMAELKRVAKAQQASHFRRMWMCVVGMPIVAPFALVPVIPNFPFFYLVYRAWCHWEARNAAHHIDLLLDHQLIHPRESAELGAIYEQQERQRQQQQQQETPSSRPNGEEAPLLQLSRPVAGPRSEQSVPLLNADGASRVAELLGPDLGWLVERGVEQVSKNAK